jgi:hypothetical protein
MTSRIAFPVVLVCFIAGACTPDRSDTPESDDGSVVAEVEEWTVLFNGHDLTGWTPKIAGAEPGEDPWNTFRVEDGLLTVSYERYEEFGDRFGHLFYQEPFSHYLLRVEYRFVGEQATGGEGWALRNSGVMFHSQAPETMLRDQDFPISLEAQFLGGNGVDERPTGNLCTPGTHVDMAGVQIEEHCITADAPTFHEEAWVRMDLLVLGDSLIAHIIDGDTVITYSRPVIGGGVVHGFDEAVKQDGRPITEGYIALQSESHPIQFREVLIKRLDSN